MYQSVAFPDKVMFASLRISEVGWVNVAGNAVPVVLNNRAAAVGEGAPRARGGGYANGMLVSVGSTGREIAIIPEYKTIRYGVIQTLFLFSFRFPYYLSSSTLWISATHMLDLAQCGHVPLGNTCPLGVQLTRSGENMMGKASGSLPEDIVAR